jgi:hypothetical protein
MGTPGTRAFWSAFGLWMTDRRFHRFRKLSTETERFSPFAGAAFAIARRGEVERFKASPFVVPNGALAARPKDVLTPQELAARHGAYRWRLIIGPSFRADCWASLEQNPEQTPAALARRTYASYSTAWAAKRDFEIVRARGHEAGRAA